MNINPEFHQNNPLPKSWISRKKEYWHEKLKITQINLNKCGYQILKVYNQITSNQKLIESYTKKIGYLNQLKESINQADTFSGVHKILVPAANLARISSLSDPEKYNKEAYKIAFYSNIAPTDIQTVKSHTQKNYGICLGMCYDFARRFFEHGADPNSILEIANKYKFGGGTKAFGAQVGYSTKLNEEYTRRNPSNQEETEETHLAVLRNVGAVFGVDLESYKSYPTPSRENLSKFDSYDPLELDNLENGLYYISIPTTSSKHAILLIKQDNQNFFFDPNYGLIQPNDSCKNCFKDIMFFYNFGSVPLDNESKAYPIEISKLRQREKLF